MHPSDLTVIDRIELAVDTHERPPHMISVDTVDKEGLYYMPNDLMRFSVAMPEELLMQFDELVARRGIAKNRSEVVRDLVRDALVEDECDTPGKEVVGTLTIVFSHHSNDLVEKLDTIQHGYYEMIISTMHIHLDEENCLEVIAMRGDTGTVQEISNRILGTKGVKHGRLVLTTTGKFI